jgi:hypothetical protein
LRFEEAMRRDMWGGTDEVVATLGPNELAEAGGDMYRVLHNFMVEKRSCARGKPSEERLEGGT